MAIKPRPYQRAAVDALYTYWSEGGGNGLIVIPTGGGKSLALAMICQELLADYPDMRIGIVTHVKELVGQNAQELLRLWPQADIGINSAGLFRRDRSAQILFMGIQSVHRKTHLLGGFDLMLVDEAHLIPRNSDTMYGRFLKNCRETVPDMRIVGLTATPYRLDSGRLDDGDDKLFDAIVYDANVRTLIEDGYLSPLISKATLAQIDTQGLHRRAGEFVQAEMDERARIPTVVEAAVQEVVEAGRDRAGWLVFCTSVEHAIQVRDEIRRHDISCETVTGDTPAGERDSIISAYKARRIRCLTSVGVLTTGFNAPHVDLLALLRPTLSTGLYIQMVGRAFRPLYASGFDLNTAEGRHAAIAAGPKPNALILDFAGNVERHGPVDAVKPRKQGGGKKKEEDEQEGEEEETVKAKVCPTCRSYVAPAELMCPQCGFEWPKPAPKHKPRAEETPILTSEKTKPEAIGISRVRFARHHKPGSPDSMKITYETMWDSYSQWICFEHSGFARDKAVTWWRRMGGKQPIPSTVTEALARVDLEIGEIISIVVRKSGQYPEVITVKLSGEPHVGPSRVQPDKRKEFNDRDFGRWQGKTTPRDPEREKIIDRVVALRNKTVANGCTPDEATSAAAKASELMTKYSISDYDVEIPF